MMAHHASYSDRFEIYEGHLVKVTKAHWMAKSMDVFAELPANINNYGAQYWWRHMEYSQCAGYLVYFPGETLPGYYGYKQRCEGIEEWSPLGQPIGVGKYNLISNEDRKKLLSCYPEFKYVLRKIKDDYFLDYDFIFKFLNIWIYNPEIESLLALGMYKLALNNSLYKLSSAKKKQIIQFITKNFNEIKSVVNPAGLALRDIQACLKYKINLIELLEFRKWQKNDRIKAHTSYPIYKYCKSKGVDMREYFDYKSMAESVGHNMKDKYWAFPSDFYKNHDKVMEEKKNVEMLNSKLKCDLLKEVLKDIIPHNTIINGYEVFVTADIGIIKKQCDVLYQCLIRNNYINKVIDQEEILVFFWRDGNPVATAEVFYSGKVGQFYGDEHDRDRCSVSDELRQILAEYLGSFKLEKRKFEYKQKFYKGFQKKLSNKEFYTAVGGGTTFEVGKTYATLSKDDEILEAGGSGCVSTSKVFHFCDSISEISNHYNPNYYCLIEPLGPVVEYNGALLSNKIRIVRELKDDEVSSILNLEGGIQTV